MAQQTQRAVLQDASPGASASTVGASSARSSVLVPGATAKAVAHPHVSLLVARVTSDYIARDISTSVSASIDLCEGAVAMEERRPDPSAVALFRQKLLQVVADQKAVERNRARPSLQLQEDPKAYILSRPGVMKVPLPRYSNLKQFWDNCAVPLCSVLRVRPFLLGRRAGESTLRLSYVPLSCPSGGWGPILRFLATVELGDFSKCLWQASPSVASCVYVALNILYCDALDEDPDTDRGQHVRLRIRLAVLSTAKKLLLSVVHVVVIMFDARHAVAVVRPCYNVGANDIALELIEHLNSYLTQDETDEMTMAQRRDGAPMIAVGLHDQFTGFVAGGAASSARSRSPRRQVASVGACPSAAAPAAPDDVVFIPKGVSMDSVCDCLCWIIGVETDRVLTCFHLRLVASMWIRSAYKHHYPVADTTVQRIAEEHGVSCEDYLEYYWDAKHCRAPPVLLVYIVGCIFTLNVGVVVPSGERPDGMPNIGTWRLKLIDGTWQVWQACSAASFGCFAGPISPTLPFLTQADEDLGSQESLHGGSPPFVAGGALGRESRPSKKRRSGTGSYSAGSTLDSGAGASSSEEPEMPLVPADSQLDESHPPIYWPEWQFAGAGSL
eukprot:5383110-Amphidinium_carterae.3